LIDIRDNIGLAEQLAIGLSVEALKADRRTFYAVPRCLEIISALFLQLPEAFAEVRLLHVHCAKLFKHTALRVVEAVHNRGQNMHVVAHAGHFGGQPLQRPADIGQIDNRLAPLVAQRGISFPNYRRYRGHSADCEKM
jgi:hypothetical protein